MAVLKVHRRTHLHNMGNISATKHQAYWSELYYKHTASIMDTYAPSNHHCCKKI